MHSFKNSVNNTTVTVSYAYELFSSLDAVTKIPTNHTK